MHILTETISFAPSVYVMFTRVAWIIIIPRYVNRVARNESHRVTVRVFRLKLFCNLLNETSCVVCHSLKSHGLSIKVYLDEVYVGMFHGAEPCTMEIDVFHILHNYSNIVSFRCNFQTNRRIYIWCKWMPNSYSWRAHTSSYSACAFMNINGYTKQLADTENKLYNMHFYLNVNDSHIHGMFIQTRFNKNKSHIYIMFQRYIYNYAVCPFPLKVFRLRVS